MAEPAPKDPYIEDLLDSQSFSLFGRKRTEAIRSDICVQCASSCTPDTFRDEVSYKEYLISGFCQAHQDEIWEVE